MIKRKMKIAIVFLSVLLLIPAYYLGENLLFKLNMHEEAVFASINDFFLSENDINDYISYNQELIDIIHYDLDINLFPEEQHIKGKAIITGIVKDSEVKEIHLNLYDNLKLNEIMFNGNKVKYSLDGADLILKEIAVADTFKILVDYEGSPRNIGLSSFSFEEKDSNYVVYTLNEPFYASTWFPCNDKPDDKALYDIKITNDHKYTSVSNGILVEESEKEGRKTFHWQTKYPTSTYLITLNSGIYETFKHKYIAGKDTMNILYFVFPEDLEDAQKDFFETPQHMKILSRLFGDYPFIKEKYGIIEFLWQSGAMEHQTLTGIGSNFVTGYNLFRSVLVHELAHHWWGNAVGPKSWKDIWLNEGFATYSEALYYEAVSGASALQSTMFNNMEFPDKRLYNPEGHLLSATVYDKGAWVLHMLRREVGDDKFFKILRNYFEKFKYKNASSYDFMNICEEVAGRNLKKFFNQWVFEGEERIELYTKITVEKSGAKFVNKLRIKQYQAEKMEFPLDIKIFGENEDDSESYQFRIMSSDSTIVLDYHKKINSYKVDPDYWLLARITKD